MPTLLAFAADAWPATTANSSAIATRVKVLSAILRLAMCSSPLSMDGGGFYLRSAGGVHRGRYAPFCVGVASLFNPPPRRQVRASLPQKRCDACGGRTAE